MSNIAISCESVGKNYRIGQQERYRALRDTLTDAMSSPLRRLRKSFNNLSSQQTEVGSDTFWALKDVSFKVEHGEVIGIIGRNGAGKSTLLKILSRITKPTEGQIKLNGRVGSLLEVGTGFHPELTGRENIYLNGAILGMKRSEIARKFDEIVAFAEIERFLDTPVKRYSSGMYVRLAFAVAAHLEPEILIIDEVLAVGDSAFQKKCLGKMGEVAKQGRTVLFVSHNMAAVSNLCSSAILVEKGRLEFIGKSREVIDYYLKSSSLEQGQPNNELRSFRPSWAAPWIVSARLTNDKLEEQHSFPLNSDITIEVSFCAPDLTLLSSPVMGVVINHMTMGTVAGVNTRMTGFTAQGGPFSAATMRCNLRNLPFLQGRYSIDLWLGNGSVDIDCLSGYLTFNIEESDVYGTGNTPFSHMGVTFLKPTWSLDPASTNQA